MKYVARCLLIVWAGLQFFWFLLNLPLMIFGALISLARTLIGLGLLALLGSCGYELYTEYQARERGQQPRHRAVGAALFDSARDGGKSRAGNEERRGGERRRTATQQSREGRRREAAAARRARVRYEAEERRLIEQGWGQ